jgi:GT2 family glycosyltransferase
VRRGKNLKISVIIPTRHRNELLAKCLERLAPGSQTLDPSDYEVVVTDDGTLSSAESMIRERYPWARWLQGPRKGPGANRNSAAKNVVGEWIVYVDDDCLPEARWLESFADAMSPGVRVLEGRTTCRDGVKSPLELAPENLSGGWLWSCNMAVRRDLFIDMGGFDEQYPYPYMEDVDFRERLRDAGIAFPFVESAIVDHPPRRIARGRDLARTHECYFIYCRKRGTRLRFASMFWMVVVARLKSIKHYRLSRDSLKALWYLGEEVFTLAIKFPQWVRRHPDRTAIGGTIGSPRKDVPVQV